MYIYKYICGKIAVLGRFHVFIITYHEIHHSSTKKSTRIGTAPPPTEEGSPQPSTAVRPTATPCEESSTPTSAAQPAAAPSGNQQRREDLASFLASANVGLPSPPGLSRVRYTGTTTYFWLPRHYFLQNIRLRYWWRDEPCSQVPGHLPKYRINADLDRKVQSR
jgi:hypothetical protein